MQELLFETEQFSAILAEIYSLDREIFCYGEEKIPLFYPQSILALKRTTNAPFCFYDFFSPDSEHRLRKEAMLELLKKYHDKNFIYKSVLDIETDAKVQTGVMSYVDIRGISVEDYMNSLSKNHRQNLRKAENKYQKNSNFKRKTVKSEYELKKVYDLLAYTYARKHKMFFHPYKLFLKLYNQKIIKCNYIENSLDGKIINAIIIAEDRYTVHYVWGMNDPAYTSLSLGYLLLADLIKMAIERKFDYVSFGSSSLSDTSLIAYKQKWQCRELPVYNYYTVKKPVVIDLESSFKLLRNLFFSMPMFILKTFMSFFLKILVQ